MNRFRIRALGYALLGILILTPGAGAQERQAFYRSTAEALVEQALALDPADHAGREDLATRAGSIDPSLADPYAILADLLEGVPGRLHDRETLLRKALAREFVHVSRDDTTCRLACLYLDHGRPEQAYSILHHYLTDGTEDGAVSLESLPTTGDGMMEQTHYLYLRALMETHEPWYAASVLDRVRRVFPEDDRLALLQFQREDRVSLAMLEWIDARDQVPAGVYRTAILGSPPGATVPFLYARYQEVEGEDPLVSLVARLHGVSERDAPLSGEWWRRDKLLWESIAGFGMEAPAATERFPEVDAILTSLEQGATIAPLRDRDRNGIPEERIMIDRRGMSVWQSDPDQDGIADRAIVRDGARVVVYLWDHGTGDLTEVSFSVYPLVSRIRWIREGRGWQWTPEYPLPVDAGFDPAAVSTPWRALTGTVQLNATLESRFDRQRLGPAARPLTDAGLRALEETAAEKERVPWD